MKNHKIAFIMGAPRSGTTLLYNMLVKNQRSIGGITKESKFYLRLRYEDYQLDKLTSDNYFNSLLSKDEINHIYSESKDNLNFFKNAIHHFLNKENKAVFVEKSPIHTLFFDQIIKDFDNPIILVIKRNPAAVINSNITSKHASLLSDRLPAPLSKMYLLKYLSGIIKLYFYQKKIQKIESYKNTIVINYDDIVLEKIDSKNFFKEKLGVEMDDLFISRPFSDEVSHQRHELDRERVEGYKKTMPVWAQRISSFIFNPPKNWLHRLLNLPFILVLELFYNFKEILSWIRTKLKFSNELSI